MDLWVAKLHISDRVREKLQSIHRLNADEVGDEVKCVEGLSYVWDDDPERGLRAIVDVTIRRRTVLVVLYPAHDPMGDAYHLGSAYPVD